MMFNIGEREDVCGTCKYFYQHYVYSKYDGFMACNAGHCYYPRLKPRKPGTDACIHFKWRLTNE